MQTSGVLPEVVKTESNRKNLKKYCNYVYYSAVTCGCDIAEALQIESGFVESRPSKKRMFKYEAEDKSCEM